MTGTNSTFTICEQSIYNALSNVIYAKPSSILKINIPAKKEKAFYKKDKRNRSKRNALFNRICGKRENFKELKPCRLYFQ